MPIKGLSDRGSSFPLLGRIRKGDAKVSESKPGRDTDHFRCDTKQTEVREAFISQYGNSPKKLRVMLPYRSADENFASWLEEWKAGGLVRRCDGENIAIELDGDRYLRYSPDTAPVCIRALEGECNCKEKGVLRVMLPELPFLGFFEIVTSSKWDILELSQNLAAIEAAIGGLQGVPLVVSRIQREISVPGYGKTAGSRTRANKWLLRLELEAELQSRFMGGLSEAARARFLPVQESAALPAASPPRQLPPSDLWAAAAQDFQAVVKSQGTFAAIKAAYEEAKRWADTDQKNAWLENNYTQACERFREDLEAPAHG